MVLLTVLLILTGDKFQLASDRGRAHPPSWPLITDRVDLFERNAKMLENGDVQFVQLIGWDLSEVPHRVVFYQMNDFTIRHYKHGIEATWSHSSKEVRYKVLAKEIVTTLTFNDPEMDNRAVWPITKRRKLGSVK